MANEKGLQWLFAFAASVQLLANITPKQNGPLFNVSIPILFNLEIGYANEVSGSQCTTNFTHKSTLPVLRNLFLETI